MNKFNNNGTDVLKGIWPVLVTPYDDHLKIDVRAYHEMIEWHIENGCHGIYALCLSSEMYHLDQQEQRLLITEAVKVVRGRVPVAVTGNIAQSVEEHIRFSKMAYDLGADIVMLTVPANLNEEESILDYFLQMGDKTDFPLGIYECPYPRHQHLSLQTIKTLADTGRYYAFKETSCRIEKIKSIIDVTNHTNLSLLQANIPFLLEAQAAGAEGCMNVAANWLPDVVVEVYTKFEEGQRQEADQLHRILCTMEMAQRSIHPTGVKYLMSKRGLNIKPNSRLPQKFTSEERKSLDCSCSIWFGSDLKLHPEFLGRKTLTIETKTG